MKAVWDLFVWNEHYLRSQWFIAAVMAAVMVSYWVWRKNRSIFMSLGIGYAILNGMFVSMFPVSVYFAINGIGAGKAAQASAAKSTMLCVLGAFLLLTITAQARDRIAKAFEWIVLINCVVVVIQSALFEYQFLRSGLMQNASMNACFIALCYPYLAFFPSESARVADARRRLIRNLIYVVLPVVAIILSASTMGILVLITGILAHFVRNRARLLWILIPIAIVGASVLIMDRPFIHDSGRFTLWQTVIDWQFEQGRVLFGSGLGMFENLGPMIHLTAKKLLSHRYFHAHNDWLQIFFQLGAIGLSLALASYFVALKRSFQNPWLFSSFLALGVFMAGNMPLHYPLSSIYAIFLISCLGSGRALTKSTE